MPRLKDDISISEPFNPRTLSPDIELAEILEFEEAAQMDSEPEQLNLFHEVKDESERVDTEHPPTLNIEIEVDKGWLSISIRITRLQRAELLLLRNTLKLTMIWISHLLAMYMDHIPAQYEHNQS